MDILVDTKPGKEDATRLAAAKELADTAAAIAAAEWLSDEGGGGGGGRQVGNDVPILKLSPMGVSLSDVRLRVFKSGLTRVGKLASPTPNFRKSKGCMFCRRFNGDDELCGLVLMLLGGEIEETGPFVVGIFRKFNECFWCGDIVGILDERNAECGTVGDGGRLLGDIS